MSSCQPLDQMKKRKSSHKEGDDEKMGEGNPGNDADHSDTFAVNDWVKSEEEWVRLCKQPEFNWKNHQFSTIKGKSDAHTMMVLREVHLGNRGCQLDSLLNRPRSEHSKPAAEKANLLHYPTVHQLQHLQSFEVLPSEQVPSEWVLGGYSTIKEEPDTES